MATSIARKLKINEGDLLRTFHPPAGFKKSLGELPQGVKISESGNGYQQIHWFVTSKAQLEEELNEVMKMIKPGVTCWIYYPKGSSGVQTDLTRDKGWEELLKHQELQWLSLISFDETWSAFAMRLKTDTDKKKEEKPKERAIFNFIDPLKKIVYLPDDFAAALKKAKKQDLFFQGLSFTNRKEYVEWIVSAKKEETRATRVKESIERLAKEWKNPANR